MSITIRSFKSIALACAFIANAATALTVIPPDFARLVAEADAVVDGTVTGVRTGTELFRGRTIVYTYVTVGIAETVKGSAAGSIELRMLGGTHGDLTFHVPGIPKFKVGDREIFFVVGNGTQFCPLVGISHGLYPIVTRPGDGARVVLRHNLDSLRDVTSVSQPLDHSPAAARGGRKADLSDTMTVAEFKRQIRAEVAHARAQ